MADLKISQLTGATTPLAGTEVVPLVQSSTTKKVAVSDLTAGRTVNAAALGVGVTTPASGTTIEARNAAAGTGIRASNSGGGFVEIACESNATSNAQLNYTNQITASGGDFKLSGANFVPTTAAKGVNFTANTPAAGMTSQLLNWYEEGTFTASLRGSTSGSTGAVNSTATYTRTGRLVSVNIAFNAVTTTGQTGDLIITGLPFTSGSTPANFVGSCLLAGYTATAPIGILNSSATQITINESSGGSPINSNAGAGKYVYVNLTYVV